MSFYTLESTPGGDAFVRPSNSTFVYAELQPLQTASKLIHKSSKGEVYCAEWVSLPAEGRRNGMSVGYL